MSSIGKYLALAGAMAVMAADNPMMGGPIYVNSHPRGGIKYKKDNSPKAVKARKKRNKKRRLKSKQRRRK